MSGEWSGDLTYLVVDVLPALWVELTGLVVLVPQKEILAMRE